MLKNIRTLQTERKQIVSMYLLPTIRTAHPAQSVRSWPIWVFDLFLLILFVGPILSPLFRATGQPLIDETGALARYTLMYICPTPAQSYMLFGFPMAVCARCWGATIGLWLARLWIPFALAENGQAARVLSMFRSWPWWLRLVICAVPFALWPLEIYGVIAGWWGVQPLWVLLLNGIQAGFAAGLLFCTLWPGFWPYSPSLSKVAQN